MHPLYALPVGTFAGSPAPGRAEEARGGSSGASGKLPRHEVDHATKADRSFTGGQVDPGHHRGSDRLLGLAFRV